MPIYECGPSHEATPHNTNINSIETGSSWCSAGTPLSTELDRIRLTQLTSKGG
ncbi:MAG TPA: hypothetical protein OIM20_04130 [Eggerthellaceae bacterium]|nr:hypothetical protein [Eggerthellaceae bacterium]